MPSLRTVARRLRHLLRRRAFERDLDDEIRFHVEMQAAKNVERGLPPDEARALAEREFGMVTRHKEAVRDARGLTWADDLGRDVRFGLRGLRRSPGFVAVAVLCLALGIGANAAIFSVVNAVLLRPLPYADPDRLVLLNETFKFGGGDVTGSVSYPNFLDWRAQASGFARMAGFNWGNVSLQGPDGAERLNADAVTADFFPVLGVRPTVGRTFAPGEDEQGHEQVAVLSDALWRRRFAGDRSVVGRTITLDGKPYTVVGVMPPAFHTPLNPRTELWVPFAPDSSRRTRRGAHFMNVVARLAPGATLPGAQAQLKAVAARLAAAYPQHQEGRSALATPLREVAVGGTRPALLVLLGAVGLVLLIACANVANLLLVRASTRRHEIAIRLALGASRARLVRQLLVESLLLALAGAALGTLLAWGALRALRPFTERALGLAGAVPLDATVFLFLLGVALLSGVVFGLVPALQASRGSVRADLIESGTKATATGRQQRLRGALVVGEIALSLVLLVGAGLLVRAFLLLRAVEPGFDTERVLTMHVAIPADRFDSLGPTAPYLRPALARLRELPGVRSAAITNMLPIQNTGFNGTFGVVGQDPPPPEQAPLAEFRAVSPGYFQTLGIPLKAGRLLAENEGARGEQFVVVNEALARDYLEGDPVGQQLTGFAQTPYTIVGVVGAVRQSGLAEPPRAEVYFSYADTGVAGFFHDVVFVVKTAGAPGALVEPVRATLRSIGPDLPVYGVRTLDEVVSLSLSWRRYNVLLLGIFAGIALLLSVVGLYGVISYLVAQRTREMGIRMALGAQARDVVRLVMRQGAWLTASGVAVGLVGAFAFTRLLAGLLYGVSARDPLTFAGVAVLLATVALTAAYVPARRASRADPLLAMRGE